MASKAAIVYGGCGALGRTLVAKLKSCNFHVVSIDLAANQDADSNVEITQTSDWVKQSEEVKEKVGQVLSGKRVDLISCVAGGWAGGNAASQDLVKNSDLMWKQSVWSSVICSHLASIYLNPEGGLLQLTGAVPALEGTPGMMGYGMAKAAVQQLTKSLSGNNSGLPSGTSVVTILPVTLDTPMNRKFMPKADFSTWTPLDFVADTVFKWSSQDVTVRPQSGSLIKFITKDSQTELIAA